MKKTTSSISLALIALLIGLSLARSLPEIFTGNLGKLLTYSIEHPTKISLDPVDSDFTPNAILMKHLVGTLIRYSNGGQFEPYLTSSFKSSKDGKTWTFKLRDDLHCQGGEAITAEGFVNSFKRLAREYGKGGAVPILSDIVGWQQFLDGGELIGLIPSISNEIEFRFTKRASSGFLEYLSMPYFGYLCAANFNSSKWSSANSIFSSGPYILKSISPDRGEALLESRSDWPLLPKMAPQQVRFKCSVNSDSWRLRHSVVHTTLPRKAKVPDEFVLIAGPPDNVRAIVLDDGPSNFFSLLRNRKVLKRTIRRIQSKTPLESSAAIQTSSFYPGIEIKDLDSEILSNGSIPKSPLKVFVTEISTDESQYVMSILERALRELDLPFEIILPDPNNASGPEITSRHKFDVRITSVVAGSVMEPWVVDMMFCSNLGISFPDPSGKICDIAKKYLNSPDEFNPREASIQVSLIADEDAAVIPVYHGRTTWYFSKDIDVSRISGDIILPSFEDLHLK